jgi:hypothetical protein
MHFLQYDTLISIQNIIVVVFLGISIVYEKQFNKLISDWKKVTIRQLLILLTINIKKNSLKYIPRKKKSKQNQLCITSIFCLLKLSYYWRLLLLTVRYSLKQSALHLFKSYCYLILELFRQCGHLWFVYYLWICIWMY